MTENYAIDSRFKGKHHKMNAVGNPTVKVTDIACLVFDRPDVARMVKLLADFGLTVASRSGDTVYLRGTEAWPYCIVVRQGRDATCSMVGFRASSKDDLERLSEKVPGAGAVVPRDEFGGGYKVCLTDPMGLPVEVYWGLDETTALPCREPLARNSPVTRNRIGAILPEEGVPGVVRLGHGVFGTPCFEDCYTWYTGHLGLLSSDYFVGADGQVNLSFLRCDRGDVPVDHHTFVLRRAKSISFQHAAFEVVDFDAINWGQQVLKAAGWEHLWGVGRHLVGTNVFDYWSDPWGAVFEHFTDGEMLISSSEPGYHLGVPANLYQWGPDLSTAFIDPSRRNPGFVSRLLERFGLRSRTVAGARPWIY